VHALHLSNLDIRQLRLFVSIVEHEGLSAAASALGIDLTAASRALSSLETRFGTRLCQRGRGGFALTSQGKAIYEQAQRLIQELSEFETTARIVSQAVKGRLRLGLIDNTLSNPKARIVQALRTVTRAYPDMFVELSLMSPPTIEIALRERQLDVAVTAQPNYLSPLTYLPVFSEEQRVFIARDHPDREAIEAALTTPDMNGRPIPFIARRYKMPSFNRMERAYPLVPVATVDNIETITTLIAAHVGVGIIPTHYADLMQSFDLVEIGVPMAPLTVTFYIAYRSDMAEEPTIKVFREVLLGSQSETGKDKAAILARNNK
jgi:DNA-binding transcriptional LysR family regulator